jgi:hypothetical protein
VGDRSPAAPPRPNSLIGSSGRSLNVYTIPAPYRVMLGRSTAPLTRLLLVAAMNRG